MGEAFRGDTLDRQARSFRGEPEENRNIRYPAVAHEIEASLAADERDGRNGRRRTALGAAGDVQSILRSDQRSENCREMTCRNGSRGTGGRAGAGFEMPASIG